MGRVGFIAIALSVAGCVFDSSGGGEGTIEPTTVAPDTADASSSGAPATTAGPGGTGATTGDPTTGTSSSSGATTTTTASTTTTGDDSLDPTFSTFSTTGATEDPCADAEPSSLLMWAEHAALEPPMEYVISGALDGKPVARSLYQESGRATFAFDVVCPGNYYLHGLALDFHAPINPNNPDTYYARVDGGPEFLWAYGCTSVKDGWQWYDVFTSDTSCNFGPPVALPLDTGVHTLTLRNREPQDGNGWFAAIAAIAVTDDPALDPNTLFFPPG